jgi:hypothetical protein
MSTGLSAVGLQTSVLSRALRRLESGCTQRDTRFALIMDQSSTCPELLEAAQKTMFGERRCRQIVSPPFEVESHLDQNMQAADWIAALVGRLWALKLDPTGFGDYAAYDKYFSERLHRVAQYSTVKERQEYKAQRVALAAETQQIIVTEQIVRTTTTIVRTRS